MSVRRSTRARCPRRLLGAHVAERAGQVAGERQAGVPLHVGHAEIGDPEVAAPVQQQVGRLDVAVDDPLVVCVAERLGGLDAQPGDRAEIGEPANRRRAPSCRTCRSEGRADGGWRSGSASRARSRRTGPTAARAPGRSGYRSAAWLGVPVSARRARAARRSGSPRLPPSMNCMAK